MDKKSFSKTHKRFAGRNTLSFEWLVSPDGKETNIIELFTDSDGAKQKSRKS